MHDGEERAGRLVLIVCDVQGRRRSLNFSSAMQKPLARRISALRLKSPSLSVTSAGERQEPDATSSAAKSAERPPGSAGGTARRHRVRGEVASARQARLRERATSATSASVAGLGGAGDEIERAAHGVHPSSRPLEVLGSAREPRATARTSRALARGSLGSRPVLGALRLDRSERPSDSVVGEIAAESSASIWIAL